MRQTINDENGLESDTTWRHLLVLVHGFNNSESEAEGKYNHYVDMLRPGLAKSRVAPDTVAKLQWPGNEAIGPFPIFDFAGYPIDVKRALHSVNPLADYLSRLIKNGPIGRQISFVGHSLGCRLILETMCKPNIARPVGPSFDVVSLMAPAVPAVLAKSGQYLSLSSVRARKILKGYSRNDWVLWLAFPAGQTLAYLGGIEVAIYIEAIGRHGNPTGFGDPFNRAGNGHGDYWKDQIMADKLLSEIDSTLRTLPAQAEIPAYKLPTTDERTVHKLKSRELP